MLRVVKHLFKVQFLLIFIAILLGIYYPEILSFGKLHLLQWPKLSGILPQQQHVQDSQTKPDLLLFTKLSLSKFNGESENDKLYLSLLGSVYDVTKGRKHYGPRCSYNFFVGRDASVSFVTGEFEHFDEATADDVIKLQPSDLVSLETWKNFYDKEYKHVGRLVGRFYDENGEPTKYLHKFQALVEQAKEQKAAADELRIKYPDCNIEWSEAKGTRVWCTKSSGGKQREWVGHPRKLFEVGSTNFRCACVQKEELDTTEVMIKTYDNCAQLAHECFYNVD